MTEDGDVELYKRLDALRRAHRVIENKIRAAITQQPFDEFSLLRFKKEKLAIRDQITVLEDTLYPDIIA
ncbi:MAG: DUF465 domain-containing protein [Sphaerospermopsis sp. SIO1G2]|nr:DUF465 domain-containing protein [Sphaerospermopsis sp. SIO1G2]